jgi:hypothetical protein
VAQGACRPDLQTAEWPAWKTPWRAASQGCLATFIQREIPINHPPGQEQEQLQTVRCYTLFFPGGRVYAGDTQGRLIALALVTAWQGRYSYTLEGSGITGAGLQGVDALLQAVASHLTADFVDQQFRHGPDLARADVFDLTAGPHLNIRLQAP